MPIKKNTTNRDNDANGVDTGDPNTNGSETPVTSSARSVVAGIKTASTINNKYLRTFIGLGFNLVIINTT